MYPLDPNNQTPLENGWYFAALEFTMASLGIW
jgi:hypothetical protein